MPEPSTSERPAVDEVLPSAAPSAAPFLAQLNTRRSSRASRSSRVPRRRRGRPVDADGEQTRRNIMAAALECFGRSGFDRTTNSQIAERAGISPPTLYHYFDSKAALFQAVAHEVTESFYARIDELVASRAATTDRVVAVIEVLGEQLREDPHLASFTAMYAAEVRRNPDVLRLTPPELWNGPVDFYTGIVAAGQRQSDVADDVDATAVAGVVMAMIYGISLLASVSPTADLVSGVVGAYERLIRGTLFDPPG